MIETTLIGTGGGIPWPSRHLTSLLFAIDDQFCLIDCGEGTDIALMEQHLPLSRINHIFLTHRHGDHIMGLPGLIMMMKAYEKTSDLTIHGPVDIERYVRNAVGMLRHIPFTIHYDFRAEKEYTWQIADTSVTGFSLWHSCPCFGYEIKADRLPEFDVEKAKALDIPVRAWSRLQHSETIQQNNTVWTPDMVMGKTRKGLKIIYATDTRPYDRLRQHLKDADLAILEGLYGNPEKAADTAKKKHMTMQEAARLAADANVKELWITHIATSERTPEQYTKELQKIFPNTIVPTGPMHKMLNFKD